MGDTMTGQRVALPFFGLDPLPWSRPSLATFSTWINQIDANSTAPTTATASDNSNGLPLAVTAGYDGTAPNAALPTCLLKSAPNSPWTITVGVAGYGTPVGGPSGGLTGAMLPLVVYNQSNDKLTGIYWDASFQTNGGNLLEIANYTNASNRATVALTIANGGSPFGFPDYFQWFRINNDGTNLNYYAGPDGFLFKKLFHQTIAAVLGSITHVGFGMDRAANGASSAVSDDQNNSVLLWSWVET